MSEHWIPPVNRTNISRTHRQRTPPLAILGLLDPEEQEDNLSRPITRSQDSDLLLELGSDGRTPRLQDTIMTDETTDALLGIQSDGQVNAQAEGPTVDSTADTRNTSPRPPVGGLRDAVDHLWYKLRQPLCQS